MPTGFGGSPGLAILGGVARGVAEEQARKRAEVTQAILDRLRQAQVDQTTQGMTLAANADVRAEHADQREGSEETRRGTMFGYQERAAQRGEASAADEQEGRESTREELIADYLAHNPGKTRADASRFARARMSSSYVDPNRDRQETRGREAQIGATRANAAESYSAVTRNNASAYAERALGDERKAGLTSGGTAFGSRAGGTRRQQLTATAAADAEALVNRAQTDLDAHTPKAAAGRETERSNQIRIGAIDHAIRMVQQSPAPDAEHQYMAQQAVTHLQQLRARELARQRDPKNAQAPNAFNGVLDNNDDEQE